MKLISETPEWKELQQHAVEMKKSHLRDLLEVREPIPSSNLYQ